MGVVTMVTTHIYNESKQVRKGTPASHSARRRRASEIPTRTYGYFNNLENSKCCNGRVSDVATMLATRMHTLRREARKRDPESRSAGRRPSLVCGPPEAGLGDLNKDTKLLQKSSDPIVTCSDISTRNLHSRIVGRLVQPSLPLGA